MFPTIEYLRWIEGRPEAATHDLVTSDLRGEQCTAGVVPGRLRDLPDPPPGSTVEELVAEAYDVDPSWVLVTPGATAANALAAAATLETGGDRVLVERPGYEPLVETPRGLGATVDRFERPRSEDFPVDPARLEDRLSGDTALVTVTNRHNPTGRLESADRLSTVAETAAAEGARLLVDEVYAPYVDSGSRRDGAFGGPTLAGHPDAVVTGSLTKFFGLGGLRVGWLVAEPSVRDRARKVSAHFAALAEPSRALARRALYNADRLAKDRRDLLEHHYRCLSEFVERRPALSGPVFDGSPFALLAHDAVDGDELADAARRAGVTIAPGRFFDAPHGCRVSLGRGREHVRDAVEAFGDTLDHLAGSESSEARSTDPDDGRLTNN